MWPLPRGLGAQLGIWLPRPPMATPAHGHGAAREERWQRAPGLHHHVAGAPHGHKSPRRQTRSRQAGFPRGNDSLSPSPQESIALLGLFPNYRDREWTETANIPFPHDVHVTSIRNVSCKSRTLQHGGFWVRAGCRGGQGRVRPEPRLQSFRVVCRCEGRAFGFLFLSLS